MESIKDILMAIIGVITLADLLKFFFIKQDRKEKDITNKDKEITAIQHTNEILQQQLDRAAATIEKKDSEIIRLTDERAGSPTRGRDRSGTRSTRTTPPRAPTTSPSTHS